MATRRAAAADSETVHALGDSVRVLEHDTRELFAAIEQLSASASAALREQMDRRPYTALAAGLVAGYVLGGVAHGLGGLAGRFRRRVRDVLEPTRRDCHRNPRPFYGRRPSQTPRSSATPIHRTGCSRIGSRGSA